MNTPNSSRQMTENCDNVPGKVFIPSFDHSVLDAFLLIK